MKAVIEFDLNDPDDDMALKRCHKSLSMAMVLFEFYYNGRKEIEYDMDIKESIAVDKVYKRFHDLLDEHSILIDELIR